MKRIKKRLLALGFIFSILLLAIPTLSAECTTDCIQGLTAEEIAAIPAPDIEQLYPDDSLLYDRSYRQVKDVVDIHDAPNGNVIGRLDAGFNYVTAGKEENGWVPMNPNQWIKAEFVGGSTVSRFAGITIDEMPAYTMGWILVNVVPSHSPGAETVEGDLPLLRYTLVNLYATVKVDDWEWYQVGPNQWVEQRNIARILPVERPADVDTERWISVDLYEQVVIAYEEEKPVFASLVSSGLPEWATNEGLFNIYVRHERTRMSGAEGQADFYYLEEVPWTMYFDEDIGLHGTYWHDGFGYRHSHGCVNMSITDAHWLYQWASTEFDFTVENDLGAAVYVYSSGEYT
jgi:hypothetical protein